MKIILSTGCLELNNLKANSQALADSMRAAKAQGADLVLHPEASLQGFEALSFDYQNDLEVCLGLRGPEIAGMQALARDMGIGVGFGFYENLDGGFYSSYLVVDEQGDIMDLYHRSSPGWKEPWANADYREGSNIHKFDYHGKNFATLICGDFWEKDLYMPIIDLDSSVDCYFWPVHTDFRIADWQAENRDYQDPANISKLAYQHQSALVASPVLYINTYVAEEGRAKGGLYHWQAGREIQGVEPGKPAQLLVEI